MRKNLCFSVFIAIAFFFVGIHTLKAADRSYYPVRDFRTDQITYYSLGPKISLFADDNLDQWTNTKGERPGDGWELKEGTLTRVKPVGDIITKNDYQYYTLEFEWCLGEKGNSGVKYRVKKIGDYYLGCEYQLLDDFHAVEKNPTASLYDIYQPGANKSVKPLGEFNHTKIVVLGDRIEHWLNGERVLLVYSGTEDWKNHVAKSKFNEIANFGENAQGKLLIQDHGDFVQIKDMVLLEYCPVR